jgi:Tfp pilus assembly protein PilF
MTIRGTLLLALLVVMGCAAHDRTLQHTGGPRIEDEAVINAPEVPPPDINPATHFAAGQLFEHQGSIEKAVIQYREAIHRDASYAPAHHRLGVLLSQMGQHPQAAHALQTAVELEPDNAIYHNDLGFEYALQQRWDKSRQQLSSALTLKPDFARARINLGMVLGRSGAFSASLQEFRMVLPDPDAYFNLGLLFRAQHRYHDAAAMFLHVLELNPSFNAAATQLAEIEPRLEMETSIEPRFDTELLAALERPEGASLVSEVPEPIIPEDEIIEPITTEDDTAQRLIPEDAILEPATTEDDITELTPTEDIAQANPTDANMSIETDDAFADDAAGAVATATPTNERPEPGEADDRTDKSNDHEAEAVDREAKTDDRHVASHAQTPPEAPAAGVFQRIDAAYPFMAIQTPPPAHPTSLAMVADPLPPVAAEPAPSTGSELITPAEAEWMTDELDCWASIELDAREARREAAISSPMIDAPAAIETPETEATASRPQRPQLAMVATEPQSASPTAETAITEKATVEATIDWEREMRMLEAFTSAQVMSATAHNSAANTNSPLDETIEPVATVTLTAASANAIRERMQEWYCTARLALEAGWDQMAAATVEPLNPVDARLISEEPSVRVRQGQSTAGASERFMFVGHPIRHAYTVKAEPETKPQTADRE